MDDDGDDEHRRGAIVDIDGTMVRSADPIPGARDGIEELQEAGIDVLYVSNTSSSSREECVRRLGNVGLDVAYEDVITAASATADYLSRNGFTDVYVIGRTALIDELERAGLTRTDRPETATALVVGKDDQFDYEKLTAALHALDDDTSFVATNMDRTTPTDHGELPGTGALVGAIQGASGRDPDVVVGKPNEYLLQSALEKLCVEPAHCIVIGDSIDIDIAMGASAGMTTILVLSGVSSQSDLASAAFRPDFVVETLAEISDVLR